MPSKNMQKLRELTEVLTSSPFNNKKVILGKYIDDNEIMGSELLNHDDISIHTLSVNGGVFTLEHSNMVLIVRKGMLFVETKNFHKKFCKGSSVRLDSDDKYRISALEDCEIISIKINSKGAC